MVETRADRTTADRVPRGRTPGRPSTRRAPNDQVPPSDQPQVDVASGRWSERLLRGGTEHEHGRGHGRHEASGQLRDALLAVDQAADSFEFRSRGAVRTDLAQRLEDRPPAEGRATTLLTTAKGRDRTWPFRTRGMSAASPARTESFSVPIRPLRARPTTTPAPTASSSAGIKARTDCG